MSEDREATQIDSLEVNYESRRKHTINDTNIDAHADSRTLLTQLTDIETRDLCVSDWRTDGRSRASKPPSSNRLAPVRPDHTGSFLRLQKKALTLSPSDDF